MSCDCQSCSPRAEDLPALDVDELRDVIAWARKSKEVQEDFGLRWNQSTWVTAYLEDEENRPEESHFITKTIPEDFCKTACCIAGNVALRNADKIHWVPSEDGDGYTVESVIHEGMSYTVAEFAQMYLGLSPSEANSLFQGTNSIEGVEALAERYCEKRGITF